MMMIPKKPIQTTSQDGYHKSGELPYLDQKSCLFSMGEYNIIKRFSMTFAA
jgi:hypothetical protein